MSVVLKRMGIGLLLVVAVVSGVIFGVGCCTFSAPRYSGPVTDHFDGERFRNQSPVEEHGFGDVLKWSLNREPGPWREWTDAEPGPPPPRRVPDGAIRVTFVNHATTLIQIDGMNVLTDPTWSDRASPVGFAGPKRVRPPGIRFEDLPPIDAVIVSHNHYDHFDVETLRRLNATFRPRFFAGLGNGALFAREGIAGATDLDWWQSVDLGNGVRLTSVPVQHFSGRGMCDRDRNLWTGYVVESESGRVYFGGDTGYGPHFAQTKERMGPMTVSILPIGAFRPEWFMAPVHVSPQEAVKAHRDLGSRFSIGMHFGTFRLADDAQDEPVEKLRIALEQERISPEEFRVLAFGEGFDVVRP